MCHRLGQVLGNGPPGQLGNEDGQVAQPGSAFSSSSSAATSSAADSSVDGHDGCCGGFCWLIAVVLLDPPVPVNPGVVIVAFGRPDADAVAVDPVEQEAVLFLHLRLQTSIQR